MKTLLLTFLIITGCGQDPLLLALQKEDDDPRASRTITVDNQSELEIMVCPYYGDDCFFSIAPGESKSGAVKYQVFAGGSEEGDIGIGIRRKDKRQIFKFEKWETLLTGERQEIRWAGNFSGVHTFTSSSELDSALAAEREPGSYYRYSSKTIRQISRALNNIAPLWKLTDNYGSTLEITAPAEDTVLYMGTEYSAGTKTSSTGDTFEKDGWHYTRMVSTLTDRMFSDYSGARSFLCRTGGCFEQDPQAPVKAVD